MNSPKISIAILVYNGWSYTSKLLMDVSAYCSHVHEIVLVDNCSTDPQVSRGLALFVADKSLPVRVVKTKENSGFIGGMNFAISQCTGDVVALLTNDIRILNPKFVDLVVGRFEEDEYILLGAQCHSHDVGWNRFGNTIFPYMNGHILIATNKFWEESGGFDTRYSPSDFEDVDISTTALKKGYRLSVLPENTIAHVGGGTYGYTAERLERTHRNKQLFAEKWGIKE